MLAISLFLCIFINYLKYSNGQVNEGVYLISPADNQNLAIKHTHIKHPDQGWFHNTEAVKTVPFEESPDTKWRFEKLRIDRFGNQEFRIYIDGNRYDMSDMRMLIYEFNTSPNEERWQLMQSKDDSWVFKATKNRCLTFNGNGANVTRADCNESTNQMWKVTSSK